LQTVDSFFTPTLFWILVGAAFVAAELALTMLIVLRSTRPTRNPGS